MQTEAAQLCIRFRHTRFPVTPLDTLAWPKIVLAARIADKRGLRRVTARPAALKSRSTAAVEPGTEKTC